MTKLLTIIAGGIAGGAAWILAMLAFFGPAQSILTNPSLQSAKFLAVIADPQSPPRMAENFWIIPIGLMVIAQGYSAVFMLVASGLPARSTMRRGLLFGAAAWILAFSWFEFYLPWNVMREPPALVALELACWLGVMLCVGLAIAWTQRGVGALLR